MTDLRQTLYEVTAPVHILSAPVEVYEMTVNEPEFLSAKAYDDAVEVVEVEYDTIYSRKQQVARAVLFDYEEWLALNNKALSKDSINEFVNAIR